MKTRNLLLGAAITSMGFAPLAIGAESFTEAMTSGTASGDIRIRYEDVSTDDGDADALTIRTRLGYKSGELNGFSAYLEFEDVRDMFGIDEKNGLIADPEVTEVDQGFLQYKTDMVTAKLGRQVITLDGHRHVGHVGWRQDRQTFDAARVQIAPSKDLSVDITHIYQRNRIFGEAQDAKSNDYLVNVGYKTPVGKVVGYGYLLDDEARDEQSDTFGVSLNGKIGSDVKFLYAVEFAVQDITAGGTDYETDYSLLELGAIVSGYTLKAGYETLGSDDGTASFTTPLATLHKFNGWADVFLGGTFVPTLMENGLEDMYVTASTKLAGFKLAAFYHDFSANEGSADYGSEIDLVVAKKFGKNYNAGVKYSAYSDDGYTGTDVDRVWVWVGASF
ncbi:MAG: alginate export family protein [Agarilytica sp.]